MYAYERNNKSSVGTKHRRNECIGLWRWKEKKTLFRARFLLTCKDRHGCDVANYERFFF